MKKFDTEFFKVQEESFTTKRFLLLMLIAYLFALGVRYTWIHLMGGQAEFIWNNQVMINTPDGYYWAEGARDILAGHHQANDLSPVTAPISILTAWLVKMLPFSFETVILWMPAVFGSLLVVPVMLIGRAFKLDNVGFVSAMFASVAWSYYHRTMAGYYDTDMLTIVLPTFVLYGIIKALLTQEDRYLLLAPLFMVLYHWWYPEATSLNSAFSAIVLLYTLIFDRKNIYLYKLFLFMLISILPLGDIVDISLLIFVLLLLHFNPTKVKTSHLLVGLIIVVSIAYIALGGLDPIWLQLKGYLFRDSTSGGDSKLQLHFFAVSKTVQEAGRIPFDVFANRISGDSIIFILSLLGYILFALRYPSFWLALPMLGLGFIAMKAGLRFTVYAIPPMALGLGYLIFWFAQRLAGVLAGERWKGQRASWGIALALLSIVLYPNLHHDVFKYNRIFTPTFTKAEVENLAKLKKIAKRNDYVLSWWDYGYPIRYYSDVKTFIDGGKHSGEVNFPVSFALTHSQVESANMARLDMEYIEKSFKKNSQKSFFETEMRDYNVSTPEAFLELLKNPNLKLPKKSQDIYYYLPFRMMRIYSTVEIFSDIDLKTGALTHRSTFYAIRNFVRKNEMAVIGKNAYIDLKNGIAHLGNTQLKLKRFIISYYDKSGKKLNKKVRNYDNENGLTVIDMFDYHRLLILDKKSYNSTYIQLFVLQNYNPKLFEPVIMTPMAKIYRLKR